MHRSLHMAFDIHRRQMSLFNKASNISKNFAEVVNQLSLLTNLFQNVGNFGLLNFKLHIKYMYLWMQQQYASVKQVHSASFFNLLFIQGYVQILLGCESLYIAPVKIYPFLTTIQKSLWYFV